MNSIILLLALSSGTWTLDPQRSVVSFSVIKHGTERVEGRFRAFDGTMTYDASNPANSSISWRVRIASVETGERDRDRTLQGSGYFDAARFPEMTFVARGVHRLPDGRIRFRGTITIRGRSKPLTIVARQVGAAPVFVSTFDLDRFDFGVDGGRVMVSRNVNVKLVVAGVRK